MSFESGLTTKLKADPGLALLIAGRIYPVILPQASQYPCLSYQVISSLDHYTMQGRTGLVAKRVQFNVFAVEHSSMLAARDALIRCLSGFKGWMGDQRIQGSFLDLEIDEFEAALDAAGPRVFRRIIDFTFWHEEEF